MLVKQNKLAIVIPAYKATYLANALDSIAAQTCQKFTLYIGDDCSPYNLERIVDSYRDKINLVYCRFDSNLGGKNLVAQWERCIDQTQGEEWLWLFSDDDIMEKNCVEVFYETLNEYPHVGLVHFNINQLDEITHRIVALPPFPKICAAKTYLDEKLKGNLVSYVVEFVVRRDVFYKCGRFQNFDMAWGSDFISWVKFSEEAGEIVTCDQAKVYWRKSNENISPNKSNPILMRKIRSLIANAKWILDFTAKKGYGNRWFYTKYPLGEIRRNKTLLSKKQKMELLDEYTESLHPVFWVRCIVRLLKYRL